MKLKCYSWLLCFSRYVIIAGLQKWISKWAAMEYRKVLTPWLTWKKKFWILDKKSSAKNRGSWPLWPPLPILLALYCDISYEISLCLSLSLSLCLCLSVSVSVSVSLSLCIYIYDTWSHAHVYIFTEITNLTYVSLKYS